MNSLPLIKATSLESRPLAWRKLLWSALQALALACFPIAAYAQSPLSFLSEPIHEQVETVESELAKLPILPVSPSPWTLGYSSAQHEAPSQPVSINIAFKEDAVVDLVVLMPATYTDQDNKVRPYGFPVRFTIESLLTDGGTDLIADYSERDYPGPGIDPQFFECTEPKSIKGLRITALEPVANPTWWHATHIVAFSECFAFSGEKNVALNAEVEANSFFEFSYVWSRKCLTDGFTMFYPISHNLTDPEDNFYTNADKVRLEIDLGESHHIDEFRLWPVVHSIQHNFPIASGFGFPRSIILECSEKSDFSDAKVLYQAKGLTLRPASGPFMHQTSPAYGRYFRLTLADGLPDFRQNELKQIALSEIQLLENGVDVSIGKNITLSGSAASPAKLARLTDGRSNEGVILPLRSWLLQFKRRVALEATLSGLRSELTTAHEKEKIIFRTVLILLACLILLLVQTIWMIRIAAHRHWLRMRERIASDLHDDIGANVSSISHTAELLERTIPAPTEDQSRLLSNLLEHSHQTYRDTQHFINFIESEKEDASLCAQINRLVNMAPGKLQSRVSIENPESFEALDPSTKWNLLLFFKEAINNVIKHSSASQMELRAWRSGRKLMIRFSDNGTGIPESVSTCRRLENRALRINGALEIESKTGEGTTLTLTLNKKQKS